MTTIHRIPFLRDHHSHPYLYATLANCLDISSISEKEKALSLISTRFGEEDPVVVTGWYDCYFTFREEELDVFPPLIIFNISLHKMIMNRAAGEMLALQFPQVVANYRDSGWTERNAHLMLGFLTAVKEVTAAQLRAWFDALAGQGVWHLEEMSLKDRREIDLLREAGLLERTRFWTSLEALKSMGEAGEFVHGIKLFADGALGAGTAGLKEDYLGGGKGVVVYGEEELRSLILSVSETGKALAVHAIGNAAIDQVVGQLELAGGILQRFPEIRLEHCQFISRDTAKKAKHLGIKLSMQPNFSLDSSCYGDRLPPSYLQRNNPFRMLIDEMGFRPGEDLLFGSDGMPHGVRAALESALFPPVDGQRLTLEEFVAGYCMEDLRNGHIDVSVDNEGETVEAEVVLDGND